MQRIAVSVLAALTALALEAKSVRYDFPQWETNTWVFLPACAYNGNRDFTGIAVEAYPPGPSAEGRGLEPQREINETIPKLNPDGTGEIEVTSGDLSVPCAGFWFPAAKTGTLIFTEAQYRGENVGYTVRAGELRLDYPARRKAGYRFNRPRLDAPDAASVPAPEDYEPKIRRIDFVAANVTEFLERFFRERKCVMSSPRAPNLYTKELLDETLRCWNRHMFVDGAYCQERLKWVPGWCGGAVSVSPLYKFGDAETKVRCRQTLDFMVAHQTAAGIFTACPVGEGKARKPRPRTQAGDESMDFLRIHCDGLWNLLKCFRTMEPKDEWKAAAKRGADALVRIWRTNKQFGQWVDAETLKILVGRSDSCAIAPAALVEAWRVFKDPEYLKVAEEACTDYCRRDLERGVVYGGPADCLMAPDSESVIALLESCVALAEATGEDRFVGWARAAAALVSTWVMPYAYEFPAGSQMALHRVNSTGSVFANVQNKHSAPGFCTMSGKGLLKLYRMTGDAAYLELLKDVASYIPQSVSRAENPYVAGDGRALDPGFMCERVNTSDWEGKDNIGGSIFYASCWCGSALLSTWAELLDEPEFGEDGAEHGAVQAKGIVVCLRAGSPDGMAVLKGAEAAGAEMTPEALWARTNLTLVALGSSDVGRCPDECAMSNVVRVASAPGARAVSLNKPTTWEQECSWLDVTREYARLCAAEGGEGENLEKSGARLFRAIVHAYWGAPGDPRLPFADPYVLAWEGRYYAYGTTGEGGFRAAVSDDLVHWEMAKGLARDGLVFAKGDGFGTREFWAPEVHAHNGRFYLFYSANRCCCVAVADSPLGPFRNPKMEPLFSRPGGQAIDNSLFVDDDGTPWMPFSDNERLAFVRLAPDLMSVVPNSWFLAFAQPKDAWQNGVEEGPSVVRVGGKYVVLFSGEGCQSQDYAVGVGVADRLTGPWTRISGYRFLHRVDGLTGTGHGSPFQLPDGSWRYVFHAHETPTIMGRRRTSVVPMSFNGVVPQTAGRSSACVLSGSGAEYGRGTVKVDFADGRGPVKPVNGVGQPPILGLDGTNMFHYLREAGIPYSRLHDVGGLFGKNVFVDIPNLFRDFDADETDPASYDFFYTDLLLKALVENGVEPYFRLGVTIENAAGRGGKAYRIFPPKDYAKWARICEHVIRHYTEGWADGYRMKISHWEIWNEPDSFETIEKSMMWKAPFSEYIRLYLIAAKHLKAKFPHLKIGGYASCGFYAVSSSWAKPDEDPRQPHLMKCFTNFLSAVRDAKAPLDFFSFHCYDRPAHAERQIAYCRKTLDEYGFRATEMSLNEWLPCNGGGDVAELDTPMQAAQVAAMLALMQNGPVDDAEIYDARATGGSYAPLFAPETHRPRRAYRVYCAFNELRKLGVAVAPPLLPNGLWACGATDGKDRSALLVANTSDAAVELDFRTPGWNMTSFRDVLGEADAVAHVPLRIPPNGVRLIRFERMRRQRQGKAP